MLKTICIHWTAGSYTNLELDHYHFVIDKDGHVHNGTKPPEANVPKNGAFLGPSDKYVQHCGGGNSFCIGVSMAGMAGFQSPQKVGSYPLTAKQCESTWKKVAELCLKYNIPVTAETVFTHYEFGQRHPRTMSFGKIDIVFLPHEPKLTKGMIGDYIRQKVSWWKTKIQQGQAE